MQSLHLIRFCVYQKTFIIVYIFIGSVFLYHPMFTTSRNIQWCYCLSLTLLFWKSNPLSTLLSLQFLFFLPLILKFYFLLVCFLFFIDETEVGKKKKKSAYDNKTIRFLFWWVLIIFGYIFSFFLNYWFQPLHL